MDLKATLKKAQANLASGHLQNEAQIKQAVIVPILRALGWDDTDPGSFTPEYRAGDGQVDYALLDRSRPRVFVEAKGTGEISAYSEARLFRYAANHGVPLLVLTNGNVWNLYLSMAAGEPNERCFYEVTLMETDIEKCAKNLGILLQNDRVVSEAVRQEAERQLEIIRARQIAKKRINSAWQALLNEPDEMLQEVLAERVEKDTGVRPDQKYVESFLHDLASSSRLSREPKRPEHGLPSQRKSRHHEREGKTRRNYVKIRGFVLNGEHFECSNGKNTLIHVIQELDRNYPEFMERLAEATKGRTRRLVSQNRGDLYDKKHLEKQSDYLENGWWAGTHLSSVSIRKHIATACEVAGIRFGSQLKLIER